MLENIRKMLSDQLGVAADSIQPGSDIVKDLGADSLDVVELLMALEDEYGVTIPEDEVAEIKTVQDIMDVLEKIEK